MKPVGSAISLDFAPGATLSATIADFSASLQRRRRGVPVRTSTRRKLCPSIGKLLGTRSPLLDQNHCSRITPLPPSVARWGSGSAYLEIDDLERAVTVTTVKPAAVRRHAIGSRNVVVHRARSVELDADETADRLLKRVLLCVDDVDARVRAIGQIVFGPVWIDPADIKRPQRVAGDLHRCQAFGISCRRRPRAGARSSAAPVAAKNNAADRAAGSRHFASKARKML